MMLFFEQGWGKLWFGKNFLKRETTKNLWWRFLAKKACREQLQIFCQKNASVNVWQRPKYASFYSTILCSKLTIETLEQCVKYVQS